MNIQADPKRIEADRKRLSPDARRAQKAAHGFPAVPEKPIRAHFLHEDRLRALGESLAKGEIELFHALEAFDFQRRIRESAERILDVYRSTNAAQARGEMVTPAAQWLLDNNYLIEETIFQIKRDLPRRFYRELPTLDLPDGKPVPRALALAWIYVAHSDSTVSEQSFKAIVEGYQTVEPLKIGELWALPSLLRFVLIENLRRIAVRVNRARAMRQIANEVADKVLAVPDGDDGPIGAPCRLCGARARHDLCDAAALPLARRFAKCRQGIDMAGEGTREIRLRRGRNHPRRASHALQRQRHHGQHHQGPAAHQRRRLDGLVRGRQPGRCVAARTLRPARRWIFPRATSTAAAIEDLARRSKLTEYEVPLRATEMSIGPTAEGSPRRAGDGAGNHQCRVLPRRSAGGRSSSGRSATAPASAAPSTGLSARRAGWASSLRSSC